MQIRFNGAARQVTGSCHLITLDNGFKVLLDCGLFQGHGKQSWLDNNKWNFKPEEIDVVIVSHAHTDHTGRLPQLVRDGFNGRIYSTSATKDLCAIMLLDSAQIQEKDVEWYNNKLLDKRKKERQDLEPRVPLYTVEDIEPTMRKFTGCPYEKWVQIHPDIEVLFRDAGHILGSASVTLKIRENGEEKTLGFSGDIGRPNRPILKDPIPMPEVDFLIMESTYGDRFHESKSDQFNQLLHVIENTCLKKKGKLIIPAFSIGRTQEIVYILDQMSTAGILPKIPVYVDSPLAINAIPIFTAHPECFDKEMHEYLLLNKNPFGFNDLHYTRSVDESKAINNSRKPAIIISASGMMIAGRIRHHLFNNVEDPKNTFLMVGYCSPDSLGAQLMRRPETIRLFGENKEVHADVVRMDSFSAHADQKEMFDFISNQRGHVKKIMLVHGEYESQKVFKSELRHKGFDQIIIPEMNEKVWL
jgi:metallo-beta-lactamase family protein